MATLPGQRASFTYYLNRYNKSEDGSVRTDAIKWMAKYIYDAPANGFTVEQVTQGQSYPVAEVQKYLNVGPSLEPAPLTEQQAENIVQATVDSTDVHRIGEGASIVYCYGYRCCPDRLKIGSTEVDTVQRIAAQISTGTPDRPVLHIEIRTNQCRKLERAIQAILDARGCKITGGGDEWFKTTAAEILAIYTFIQQQNQVQN
jgi:hypothetical protein